MNKMRRFITILAAAMTVIHAWAEPEIKGTAPELEGFLKGIPKSAVIIAEAEVRTPAHRAVLNLKVTTENHSLAEALRANHDVRTRISEQLIKQGIVADAIQAARFSSTPKYGFFGDKAKSYRVDNLVRIIVQDERQFQAAAAVVDAFPEVQFGGVDFEYADRESLRTRAIASASDNADARRKIYEEKFGLKLIPVSVGEGPVVLNNFPPGPVDESPIKRSFGTAASANAESEPAAEAATAFGELVCTARVTVEYSVSRN